MSNTMNKHTMKNILGQDQSLCHLLFSPGKENGDERLKMRTYGEKTRVMYLTEDNEEVEISEAIKVTDANLNPNKIIEDFKSRFPDGEYKGRGIWLSSE